MKKEYSRFALTAAAFLFAGTVLQIAFLNVFKAVVSGEIYENWKVTFSFVNVIISVCMIAFSVFLFLNRKAKLKSPEEHKLGVWRFLLCILILIGMNGFGSLLGSYINRLMATGIGVKGETGETVQNLSMGSSIYLRILVFGICAPVVEEFVFRKFLVDRLLKYGEWNVIFLSAVLYALYQGGFSQFFYALLMGGFLTYIYIRTGKIWYTVALHAIMNLFTNVIAVLMLNLEKSDKMQQLADLTAKFSEDPEKYKNLEAQIQTLSVELKPSMIAYSVWTYALGILSIVGFITFIVLLLRKKFVLKETDQRVEKGMGAATFNLGFSLYFLAAILLFVIYYLRLSA